MFGGWRYLYVLVLFFLSQSRTVSCQSASGLTVADSYCDEVFKPSTTQTCSATGCCTCAGFRVRWCHACLLTRGAQPVFLVCCCCFLGCCVRVAVLCRAVQYYSVSCCTVVRCVALLCCVRFYYRLRAKTDSFLWLYRKKHDITPHTHHQHTTPHHTHTTHTTQHTHTRRLMQYR